MTEKNHVDWEERLNLWKMQSLSEARTTSEQFLSKRIFILIQHIRELQLVINEKDSLIRALVKRLND